MKITPYNLIFHELIGLECKVVNATHKGYIGINGIVYNETQKMIAIKHEGKVKWIPKRNATFRFRLPTGEIVEVDGKVIYGRPEERLLKKVRRW